MGRCSYNRILNIKKEKIHSFFFSNKKVKKLRKHIESKQLLLLRARARKTKYCSLPMEFFFFFSRLTLDFGYFCYAAKANTRLHLPTSPLPPTPPPPSPSPSPPTLTMHRNQCVHIEIMPLHFQMTKKKEIILKRIKTKMIVE